MLQLIKFFTNNRVGLLFVLLEFIAFVFIIKNHSFHHSKYLNSANTLSGSIHKKSTSIKDYFGLKSQNDILTKENEYLKNKLERYSSSNTTQQHLEEPDTSIKYKYISSKVVYNSYLKRNNILTIDKGSNDSIQPNMGVILSNGIVGITLKVSKNFTTILALLNSQTKINAKMKNSHHYGSLEWNGEHFTHVQLTDLPIQANIKIGDTIISGGRSVVFPEKTPIGTITDFTIDNKSYTNIDIKLFADFSSLNTVYVVKNRFSNEQLQLEIESINE
jgi:rod shape-determining protein MreC